MNTQLQHHYKRLRLHQWRIYTDGSGCLTTYPCGKTELSYGSAPYGEHALSAITVARSHINFIKRIEGY